MDNDSADATFEGRSFHVHAATTTVKARLMTVDSLMDGTTRRLYVIEWSKVLWREFVQDFVCQDGPLRILLSHFIHCSIIIFSCIAIKWLHVKL